MSNPFRSYFRLWLIFPAAAVAFLVWIYALQITHLRSATRLFEGTPKRESTSSTGYSGRLRELIVPERNTATYHLIAQTQQMFAHQEWRIRRVDYDNAPLGREVNSASPPRWWLGLLAGVSHGSVSGLPLGAAVETAALFADPLLHLLLLVSATLFVARKFGSLPAALISVGLALIYPFSASFSAGMPDEEGLAQICAFWSVLLLLSAVLCPSRVVPLDADNLGKARRSSHRGFIAAGIAGGLGLWISVSLLVPVLIGIGIGALAAAWLTRRPRETPVVMPIPASFWRLWALSGASTVLIAYFLEFFPDHLGSWQLQAIHPLYGLAWLGAGELLCRFVSMIQGEKSSWRVRDIIALTFAVTAIAAVPSVMIKTHDQGFLALSTSSFRLSKLAGAPFETGLQSWLGHEGLSYQVLVTFAPVLLFALAGWQMLRLRSRPDFQAILALSIGPALVALTFAGWRMNAWALFDNLFLVTLAALSSSLADLRERRSVGWACSAFVALLALLGACQLVGAGRGDKKAALSEAELMGLIDRDLGHWLAKHSGPSAPIVLAPPKETTSLVYYGGLRGLGTLARENEEGITAAVRLVSASTAEEAKELIDRRGIQYIIIPSWDSYLDQYARMGMGQLDGTFLVGLHTWKLPPWLRPVAYQLPTVAGFEGQSVQILEVVEDQEDAVALSRLAEYFIEMEQVDQAAAVAQALRRFPADLGALVARAQVELARNDSAAFGRTIELLKPRLSSGGDRNLLWDRRASLAVVLARAKLNDLSRVQVQRCLTDIDEANLRSLTTGALYRLGVLEKAFGLPIKDERLRDLAVDLLPADLQAHLRR